MAQKEVFDLDFEVDSRELDQADKKLRSLDKLLQQTQRRASVLGKTKIAPKITLEDRFTAAADKVERRLSKLRRTTVRPIVGLADGVTAAAARIRASLLGLTGTPWRVRVEGVDWDGVIGGSFSSWMGSKGKETLQQISSSIGSSLGGGLKDMMMGALGLVDAPKEAIPIPWINLVEEDRELLKENNESPYAVAGRKAGETFFQAFLGTLDSKQIAEKIGAVKTEKKDDTPNWQKVLVEFAKNLGMSLLVDRLTKAYGENVEQFLLKSLSLGGTSAAAGALSGASKGTQVAATAAATTAYGTPLRTVTYGSKGSILARSAPLVKGLLGPASLALTIYDTQKYFDDTGLSDAFREAPKMIWDDLTKPSEEKKINGKPVKDMGYFEMWKELGIQTYNDVTDKESWSNFWDALKYTGRVVTGQEKHVNGRKSDPENSRYPSLKRMYPLPKIKPGMTIKPSPTDPDFPKIRATDILGHYQKPNKKTPAPTVNITIPQGAVNLTVSKDELDYEKIAIKAARKLANEIRLAMQNVG